MSDTTETTLGEVLDVPLAVPPAMAPAEAPSSLAPPNREPGLEVFGVRVTDVSRPRAVELLADLMERRDGHPRSAFFVNAHTLNLAHADAEYRRVLATADYVFADGTGVRWAARMKGIRLCDNVNGTDLTPELLSSQAGSGRRYFLLGADSKTIQRAAELARRSFPAWDLVGAHHGYVVDPEASRRVIQVIRAARPDLLLVGMGNPLQEKWIARYRDDLGVPLCVGVGGLFDFWAEKFGRAPAWLRRLGHEWIWRLLQDPRTKARRYLLGNPLFLWRAVRDAWWQPRVHPG